MKEFSTVSTKERNQIEMVSTKDRNQIEMVSTEELNQIEGGTHLLNAWTKMSDGGDAWLILK